jgi:hypothetical protein
MVLGLIEATSNAGAAAVWENAARAKIIGPAMDSMRFKGIYLRIQDAIH